MTRIPVDDHLDRCRERWARDRHPAALWDGLAEIEEYLPEWINEALVSILLEYIKLKSDGTGRHSRWLRESQQERDDRERYLEVQKLMDSGIGVTAASEAAADALGERGFPHVEGNTVARTYRKVKRRLEANPDRYFIPKYFDP